VITASAYQGKTIGVFGLARTGIAAVKALARSGARVAAWDDNAERRTEVTDHLVNLYTADFTELDALLLAPGVPLTHPKPHELVEKAREHGTPLISDLDVFQAGRADLPPVSTVAITGTNGKSTTTSLIGHLAETCGRAVAVGGNIGTGVLSLECLPKDGTYVFELSSFQLDLTSSFAADIAVLLNVTPDHLDRHGTFDNYVAAKKRLFAQQDTDAIAVVGVDDQSGQKLADELGSRVIKISTQGQLDRGVYVLDGLLVDAVDGDPKPVGNIAGAFALQGEHNWQNAAAAYAVGVGLGFEPAAILDALLSFEGLEHRQENLGLIAGVRYVNDSKATNSDAAKRALASFSNIHWIAGGRAKESSFSHLLDSLGNVKTCHFIGEAAGQLAGDLIPPHVTVHAGLEEAVAAARAVAVSGDTILLSPACTAFDQFADFEARGIAFKRLVQKAQGETL
jgi:UDP-N-acetylmuramoylalanine--D-glutamate ligase